MFVFDPSSELEVQACQKLLHPSRGGLVLFRIASEIDAGANIFSSRSPKTSRADSSLHIFHSPPSFVNLVAKVCSIRYAHVAVRQTDHRRGRANAQIERGDVLAFPERLLWCLWRVVEKRSVPSTRACIKLKRDVFLLSLEFGRVPHEVHFAIQISKRAFPNAHRAESSNIL